MLSPDVPEAVAAATGVDTTRRLTRPLAAGDRAGVYGRFGTTTQVFGSATSWLTDVLNIITGNLDRPGGMIIPWPATGSPATKGDPGRGPGPPPTIGASRVRGVVGVMGEPPITCLGEEIDTAGDGRVRALITIGGNSILSTPNGRRLDTAFNRLPRTERSERRATTREPSHVPSVSACLPVCRHRRVEVAEISRYLRLLATTNRNDFALGRLPS